MDTVVGAIIVAVLFPLMYRYADEGLRPSWSETLRFDVAAVVTFLLCTVVGDLLGTWAAIAVGVLIVAVVVVRSRRRRRGQSA